MDVLKNNKGAVMAGVGVLVVIVIVIIYYLMTTPASAASPVATAPSGPAYVGCYTDQTTRALPTMNPSAMNMQQCQAAAKAAGSPYFGLQFGNPATGMGQCFYGGPSTTLANAQQYGAATSCLPVTDPTTLAANPGAYMGGSWSNAVYST